jgi:adenine C2-methylase RlmN of 23S rRNA A2503 and tRNA A37
MLQLLPILNDPTTGLTPMVLPSEQDSSVNFVSEGDFAGTIEARYVRRENDYFIVYLSAQTGCRKACRFCHLTQTGQTKGVDVSVDGLLEQAEQVLAHYAQLGEAAKSVHFNFMARGEVFANALVLANADTLVDGLGARANALGLIPRYKFSTIMPTEMAELELTDVFRRSQPDVYYSLYSMNPAFRRRWLPKAIDPQVALDKLVRWQQLTRKIPVLHWAFIAGENDDEQTITDICEAVAARGLLVDFNIVRYNPYSDRQGREPEAEVIEARAQQMLELLPASRVKIVGRVGFDVKASCGMFVAGKDASRAAFSGSSQLTEASQTRRRQLTPVAH